MSTIQRISFLTENMIASSVYYSKKKRIRIITIKISAKSFITYGLLLVNIFFVAIRVPGSSWKIMPGFH